MAFETPELSKDNKLTISGDDAKEIFIHYATRNGKVVKDQLARKIWLKHGLPMYRNTIVEEVPFQLRISQVLYNFREYKITVVYSFINTD